MPEKSISKLDYYVKLALNGTENDVDSIMKDLKENVSLIDTKFIDYALGLVKSTVGVERITGYLFNGTQIQRNYCTLFFNRRCEKGDWNLVKKAYFMGLIDEKQAFSK
jgi:hypothetical protein